MTVTVLLSSGDEDTWNDVDDVQMDMELGGALVVTAGSEVAAVYAPGMWMRLAYTHEIL